MCVNLLSLHSMSKHMIRCVLYIPFFLNLLLFSGDRRSQGNNRNFRGGKKQHHVPNAHVRSEIKDLEQVRKERQKKANKVSFMKSKSSKGKKFNGNGNGKGKGKRGKGRK